MVAGPSSADSRNGPRLASQMRSARAEKARQSSPLPGRRSSRRAHSSSRSLLASKPLPSAKR
jgi:hypothetical protein